MTQAFSRQRWLHRILNMPYPLTIRAVFAVAAFTCGMLVSLDWQFSKLVFRGIIGGNDLKSEARRVSWMAKRGWLRLPMPEDPMFEFCQGLNNDHLRHLEARLQKISIRQGSPLVIELDRLRILANLAQYAVENNLDTGERLTSEKAFQQHYDQIVRRRDHLEIPQKKPSHHSGKAKQIVGANSTALLRTLEDLHALFASCEHAWFVIAGTFLGLVREGSFIKNDLDIDIGVMAKDVTFENLLDALKCFPKFRISRVEHQTDIYRAGKPQKRLTFVRLIHKNGTNVDVFFHFQNEGSLCHGTSCLLWKNSPFKPVKYTFYGLEIFGPDNPDTYLSETYGDWKTPVTNYNYHRDMKSLTGAPNFLGSEYLLRREIYYGKEM